MALENSSFFKIKLINKAQQSFKVFGKMVKKMVMEYIFMEMILQSITKDIGKMIQKMAKEDYCSKTANTLVIGIVIKSMARES